MANPASPPEIEAGGAAVLEDRRWQIVLWIGFMAAFSPVLQDLFTHLVENAWARASLIFPWLAYVAGTDGGCGRFPDSGASPATAEPTRALWIWLGLGIAIELLAMGGGVPRLGRVGLLVAGIGLAQRLNGGRLAVALLLVWILPLPKSLIELVSPQMQSLYGVVAAAFTPGVEFDVLNENPGLTAAAGRLQLLSTDSGLAMVYAFGGLGWFRGLATGDQPAVLLSHALRWAGAALALQAFLVVGASVMLGAGSVVDVVRGALDHGGWLLVVGLGLALSMRGTGPADSPDSLAGPK